MQITSEDQLKAYLFSNNILLKDYVYNEKDPEKNKYGIQGKPPLENPYLWNVITKKHMMDAIEFLVKYKQEWIDISVTLAIIQGIHDDKTRGVVLESLLDIILDCMCKNQPNMLKANMDQVLMCTIQEKMTPITVKVVDFISDNGIELNPEGAFMYGGLSEAAKTADMNLIHLIEKYFPESIIKCGAWPFLNAMKYGLYEIALYFAQQNKDNVHAKNDLGYKLIERNDTKGIIAIGKNKEAHDFLLNVYRGQSFL